MGMPKKRFSYDIGSHDTDLWWDYKTRSWVCLENVGMLGGSSHAKAKTFAEARRIADSLFSTGVDIYIIRWWNKRGESRMDEFYRTHARGKR